MAEIKVKDLPIQPAPQLTDYAITDNAAGTLTEKTTWQAIKDLIGGGGGGGGIYAQAHRTSPQPFGDGTAVLWEGVINANGVSFGAPGEIEVSQNGIYQISWVLNLNGQPN